MRISTKQIFQPGVAAMQDQQTQISRTQLQLALPDLLAGVCEQMQRKTD